MEICYYTRRRFSMDTMFIYHQQGKDPMYKIWHELVNRVLFLYVDNGNGSIVTHEKVFSLKKGSLYFIGAKKSHYTMPKNADEYVRDKLFISVSHFEAIRKLCDSNKKFEKLFSHNKLICAQIPSKEQETVAALFSDLQQNRNNGDQNEAIIVSICARLLAFLDKYKTETPLVSANANFVFQAIEYINNHISEPLSIDSICATVFMSKYYFCRTFKKETGLSVMEYILSTRISLAQEMLLNGNLSISQISDRCGFSSLAYFCNIFKKKNGKTPLQYRRESAQNANL